MAVPRPLLLALLGVVLLSMTFMATRSSRERADDSGEPAAQQPAASQAKDSTASKATAAEPASKPRAQKSQASSASEQEARARPKRRSSSLSKPAAVARAIGRGRIVILAFFQPGADDRATASAVAALKPRRWAVVVTDRIDNVGRYGPLIEEVGVDQAPAVVIVDRDRNARLIKGYVDSKTLAQEVADARG
jgi:hypothetical protein